MNIETVIKELRQEIKEMLIFFVRCDIQTYGYVTDGTKEAFRVQKVEYPAILDTIKREVPSK